MNLRQSQTNKQWNQVMLQYKISLLKRH